MDDTRTPNGIDFFDFLYEIWQSKWLFLSIVSICTALAAVPLLLNRNTEQFRTVETTISQFGFRLNYGNDPLNRNGGMVLGDFLGRVDADGKLGLVYAGQLPDDRAEFDRLSNSVDRTYAIRFIGQNGIGYVVLNIKDGTEALYQSIYDEFARASEEQFTDARAIAEGTLSRLDSLAKGSYGTSPNGVPDAVVASMQFLSTPSVGDNTYRFMDLRPLELKKTESTISLANGRNALKTLVLGFVVGFVLACVAMTFRIAIRRKGRNDVKA